MHIQGNSIIESKRCPAQTIIPAKTTDNAAFDEYKKGSLPCAHSMIICKISIIKLSIGDEVSTNIDSHHKYPD